MVEKNEQIKATYWEINDIKITKRNTEWNEGGDAEGVVAVYYGETTIV